MTSVSMWLVTSSPKNITVVSVTPLKPPDHQKSKTTWKPYTSRNSLFILVTYVIKHWQGEMPSTSTNQQSTQRSQNSNQIILSGFANVQDPEDLRQYIDKDTDTKESCCTLCTFRSKIPALVKNHLEGIHFPGVFTYSCEQCDKTFNGRNALGVHNSKVHSKKSANRF